MWRNLMLHLAVLFALVVPAGDVRPGDVFDITVQSSAAFVLHIDDRLELLAGALTYPGSAATRYIRLRVRQGAWPGLAWIAANGELRAVRICCQEAPAPRFHVHLPMVRR